MDTRPFAITVSSLEALILDRSRWWYREEDDLIEDIVYSIERREVHNGIDVGDVAAKDVKDATQALIDLSAKTDAAARATSRLNEKALEMDRAEKGAAASTDSATAATKTTKKATIASPARTRPTSVFA
mgnify:CR=1 FL=1